MRGAGLHPSLGVDKSTDIETTSQVRNVFVFIGVDPETDWLRVVASCWTQTDSSSRERPCKLTRQCPLLSNRAYKACLLSVTCGLDR